MVAFSALCLCCSSIGNVFRGSKMTSSGISSNNLPAKATSLASCSNFLFSSSSGSALTDASTLSSSSKTSFFSSVSSNLAFFRASSKDFFLALAKATTSLLLMRDRVDSGSNYESRAFLFRVVLEFEGLWFEGSCVFGCLNEIKGLGSDEGGGSYSWWVVWASDRFNINSQLEHLQAKYVGTGHADLNRFEWAVNIQRDSYASYIGHYPLLGFFAIAENESIGRERYSFMQKMLLPCGLPPEREED
ncbi:hypothetical protein JHK86_050077 [Glycine max]|nr:hypothetical protein JHK86_050077 [Glycine max]